MYNLLTLIMISLLLALVGCGGDGDELAINQASITSVGGTTLTVTAVRSDGTASLQLSADEPIVLEIELEDASDDPIPSTLITATSSLVAFLPAAGTALTDSRGRATITAQSNGTLGAGVVVVSATVNGEAVVARINLEVLSTTNGADTGTFQIEMALTSDADSGLIRADAEGLLTVTVVDGTGQPAANELITLSVTEGLAQLGTSNGILLSSSSGRASTTLQALTTFGGGSVTASVTSGGQTFTRSINFLVTEPAIQLGVGQGSGFIADVLDITVSPLSAGGTTTVSVNVVDDEGTLFTDPVVVQFTSTCVQSGLATIDGQVTTINGTANATYQAAGCQGVDTVSATASFGGATFSAESDLTVQQDSIGSIVFSNADPTQITLLGTGAQGLSESATVSFQVFGQQGLPIANQTVNFALTTAVGGITLAPLTAIADANGLVSTVVQAGSVSTSVGVIATVDGTTIATQSDLLAITTGIPDQDSMSIAANICAPEALNEFNEEVIISAGVADAFNNPVPDGTAVTFTTEGGVIEGICTTTGGICSVIWSSQEPTPADGLVTIMASAIGHESFQDENGNGVFDDGDTFDDLTEAFLDSDKDGVRDSGERYLDFDEDGQFDTQDGLYSGMLCRHSTLCSSETNVTVRSDREIVMAGSFANIFVTTEDGTTHPPGDTVTIDASAANGGRAFFSVRIEDVNGNSMPTGSTVEIATENGELLGLGSHVIGCRITPVTYSLGIVSDGVPDTNSLSITVTTPRDNISTRTIFVTD